MNELKDKIHITNDPDYSYRGRTIYNARNSDLTISFGIKFNTSGEKLTRKYSYKFFPVNVMKYDNNKVIDIVNINIEDNSIINIAGNSMARLSQIKFPQKTLNLYVYYFLKAIPNIQKRVKLIRSGGQSGGDLAGIVAGYLLDIPVEVRYTKTNRVIGNDGASRSYSSEELYDMIQYNIEICKEGL